MNDCGGGIVDAEGLPGWRKPSRYGMQARPNHPASRCGRQEGSGSARPRAGHRRFTLTSPSSKMEFTRRRKLGRSCVQAVCPIML
jgi:hypothetical protein